MKKQLAARVKCGKSEVEEFIESLARLPEDDQDPICQDLNEEFFAVVAQARFAGRQKELLTIYQTMVDRGNYGWSFSEHVAGCMNEVVKSNRAAPRIKAHGMDLAIRSAKATNQFNAFRDCERMISGVTANDDAIAIRSVLLKYPDSFLRHLDPNRCENDILRQTLRNIREAIKSSDDLRRVKL